MKNLEEVIKREIVDKSLTCIISTKDLIIEDFLCKIQLKINNEYEAIMIGIISGLGSTGSNEIIKQIKGKEEENEKK